MSHWTVCKLAIRNPNMELLKQALQVLAQKLGSGVKENMVITGWNGQAQCPLAIPLNLPYGNGYGVLIENGEIKVVVDDHGAPLSAKAFVNELQRTYMALAVAQATQVLGWTITNVQELQEGILMEVETYA